MRGRRAALLAVSAMALLFVSGCTGPQVSAEGTWGTSAAGTPQLMLEANGQLAGTDGCNQLVGSWKLNAGTIEFGEVASTAMACEGVDSWLSGLSTAVLDGSTMHVHDSGGVEIGTLVRS